jgi:hypothetical protein
MGAKSTDRSDKGFGIFKIIDGKNISFQRTNQRTQGANSARGRQNFSASGGIINQYTESGPGITYRTHTFTSTGTLTINNVDSINCDYLIVGGGGGTTSPGRSGGGGGGGYLSNIGSPTSLTLTSSPGVYLVEIGAGGAVNSNGSPTSFSSSGPVMQTLFTAIGGGRGGAPRGFEFSLTAGGNGASGGGGGAGGLPGGCCPPSEQGRPGGSGTSGQGNAGGSGSNGGVVGGGGWFTGGSGGGGGAGSVGGNSIGAAPPSPSRASGGNGGNGIQNSITGTSIHYAGGGGGDGGQRGDPAANVPSDGTNIQGTTGLGGGPTANRGGGGTGGNAVGGSGIVVIRYSI